MRFGDRQNCINPQCRQIPYFWSGFFPGCCGFLAGPAFLGADCGPFGLVTVRMYFWPEAPEGKLLFPNCLGVLASLALESMSFAALVGLSGWLTDDLSVLGVFGLALESMSFA